jgi:CheY-specific phosphatase CheX
MKAAHWVDAVTGAAREIATYQLGFATGTASTAGTRVPPDPMMIGAHVALVGSGQNYELALVATPEDCAALARAMLASAKPAALSATDVVDAVGELVNMMAGAVKRRMHRHGLDFELGLPVPIKQAVQPTDGTSVLALPTQFGPIQTHVLVIGRRG